MKLNIRLRCTYILALLGFVFGSIPVTSQAQWSHKAGDPAPAKSDILVQEFTRQQWDASNFASEKDMQWFRDAKYGMFIHFGLSTHHKAELSWGTAYTRKAPDVGHGPVKDEVWTQWPKEFKFEQFDAKEIVANAQRAGFKYIVAIAKHHEGFHLWNTAHSDFNVMKTPFGRDYLKELADACHAAGMKFGIYYSQRDWYHPDYQPVDTNKVVMNGNHWKLKPGETSPLGERHQKYIDYQYKVCRELCTNYGKVDVFWFDACWWENMFTAEMWDSEKLTRMIRELQPGIIINNRASIPGDFDTPEQKLGSYQDWRAWESCMCLTKTWSYSGLPPKSRDQIINMIVNNTCGDGNVLLSWGPQWNGAFAPAEIQRLAEVGDWLKQNAEAIYQTRGGPWKVAAWGGSVHRGKTIYLHILNLSGTTLRLPVIPGRTVVNAELRGGGEIPFTQDAKTLQLTVAESKRTAPDTIIKLTMDLPVDSLPAIAAGQASIFTDSATYGRLISQEIKVKASSTAPSNAADSLQLLAGKAPLAPPAFATTQEKAPWVELDLGGEMNVTGLRILNGNRQKKSGAATQYVLVSKNGQKWDEVGATSRIQPEWELPVMDFLAGTEVAGRKVRYLRIENRAPAGTTLHLRQIQVFAKE